MSSRDEGNEYPFFFDDEIQMYDLNRWNETNWETGILHYSILRV